MSARFVALCATLLVTGSFTGCGPGALSTPVRRGGAERSKPPEIVLWPPLAETAEEERSEAATPETLEPAPALPLPHADAPVSPTYLLQGDALGLLYLEIVFGDVEPDATLPLVLVLHGRGDRPRVPGGPFYDVRVPCRIVMPRAPLVLGDGFTWLPVSITEHQDAVFRDSLAARIDHLAQFLASVARARPTLGQPIVTGFSQGGFLTLGLALLHPEAIAHAFPLAGFLPSSLVPLAPLPGARNPRIRSMHGLDDPIVPFRETADLYARLEWRGFDVELDAFEGVGHAMDSGMNERFGVWLEEALSAVVADGATRAPVASLR